ncbi:hypothetical protein BDF20DRAFT_638541 [Mycotypha africana]|uniref:uncharacterized protein n=1 Tax=Mycotypha africana TaxID=64632 RepID=UPI0022FFFC99|nr:uncharacterized protein BDF20DRAFT_638541 [Mycotypha africana]KAI8973262.1 hypothetical protein BDF20DRAFT_638541 [Mycotypha africana]
MFGSVNASTFKYIAAKFYHPSTRFYDLHGLSSSKGGECDLIQANNKFIALPLSGPGGRIGIINAKKPGRLPAHIPCLLCNSEVSNFKFDPFNENILVTVSNDNKIRLWEIPEDGIEEDVAEPKCVLRASNMDKIQLIEFHPNSKDVLLTTSNDLGSPSIRIWDLQAQKDEITLTGQHKDIILSCAWSPDGTKIATHSKDKKVRILDARTGDVVAEGPSHQSIRPSRLAWVNGQSIVSVGFGLGSSREVLLFKTQDLSRHLAKKTIDISPSLMSIHYDQDCQLLFVAGRGDRTIHPFHIMGDEQLISLPKIEGANLQQGFAFLPKSQCNVKEIEIERFYRLSPDQIEQVGVRVPRARPEYFQDDIFVPTADIENPAQDAASWFKGENKQLERIPLKPEDMEPLSSAPPPASQAQSKAKFEMGKQEVTEEQRKKEQMERMFAIAKSVEGDEDEEVQTKKAASQEDEEVADEEWDD